MIKTVLIHIVNLMIYAVKIILVISDNICNVKKILYNIFQLCYRIIMDKMDKECITCEEGYPKNNECPKSKRPCGHHCNHSWTHDECCWCGKEFREE